MSVVLLVLLAIAPAKDFFADWHVYQRGYERLISKRSDAVTLRRHFEPGIQQIWLPEMGVVDRCTTCHSALKEATLADVTIQPYRSHPPIPHKPEEMGCSICHRGQGTATSVEDAHKSTLAWEEPLLPAKYLESSCGQCHQQDLKGTPQLNLGPQDAERVWLRSLPHDQAARWHGDYRDRRSAVAGAHCRQDDPGMDLCVAEGSAGILDDRDHAELQAER